MKAFMLPILFLLVNNLAGAFTVEVCPTCVWTSVGEAIAKACDRDTILIREGLYAEYNIFVERPLVILGEVGAIIDASGQGAIMLVTADSVQVHGLTFLNTGQSYVEDRAGIRLRRVRNFTVANNTFEDTYFAIYLENSREGVIRDNMIRGKARDEASSGNGIHLWYCKRILIENNRIRGHRDGIYLEFADSSQMINNLSERNLRYGLHFMFSNDDDYFGNTFRRNGAGVAVMFSRRINMWENTFAHNWGKASYGLLLKEIYDLNVDNNLFLQNTIGILVEGSNRVNYRENTFARNGWAIKMAGGCLDNNITRNNFLTNSFDLAVYSGGSSNAFDGNFWSAYDGYDLDRDGIGDVHYRPVKLFNYIVNRTPEAMILLRSLFIDLLNFAEKVSPVFTPDNVSDHAPLMKKLDLHHPSEMSMQ
jgi:nitrous oxidase accessory protein